MKVARKWGFTAMAGDVDVAEEQAYIKCQCRSYPQV
jgi:hypothetical protein